MSALDETPRANRVRIAFFGLRNAGKSTLVNAFTGQDLAIVSPTPGTTTDPVSKAMEILPLGPCLVTDTAGLDDEGELGAARVRRTLDVLATTDIAVWVDGGDGADASASGRAAFDEECRRLGVTVVGYRRGDSVDALRRRIAAIRLEDATPGLLDGLVAAGDAVLCVCPIDESAPKGRLILPQVQVLRECLDRGAVATVCQPAQVAACLASARNGYRLVVTDSQAFRAVAGAIPADQPLTSFSILFARQKGDLAAYLDGLGRIDGLRDGDLVLVAEGCTHHRQCNDIGTVRIPRALERLTGRRLSFAFASGGDFLDPAPGDGPRPALIVQCGGCMLTRREVLRRIGLAKAAGIPIVNYGLLLAKAAGIPVGRCARLD